MIRRIGSVFLLCMSVFAAQAGAQAIRSPYRFVEETQSGGAFAGYIWSDAGTVGLGPESGPLVGGRYTIRLSGAISVEVEAGYFDGKRVVRDTVATEDSTRLGVGEAHVRMLLANGGLRFNLTGPRTWHNLQPFVSVGAGAAVDFAGENGDDAKVGEGVRYSFGTSFAGQFGGGIEWFATRRITVRLDARNVLWKVKTPASFVTGPLRDRTPADEWVRGTSLAAGLTLVF